MHEQGCTPRPEREQTLADQKLAVDSNDQRQSMEHATKKILSQNTYSNDMELPVLHDR
jgi:hypothetical protein